jgi:hypothetical protein
MERPSLLAIFSLIFALMEILALFAALASDDDPATWIILFLWGIFASILGAIARSRVRNQNLGGQTAAMAALVLGVGGCVVGLLGTIGSISDMTFD